MSRVGDIFESLAKDKRIAFMPYLTAGYPSLSLTQDLILALADSGASVIEIGVPFSDPLADGPTIQMSSQRALEGGATLSKVIELGAAVRNKVDCGLVVMTYINPVHTMGYDRFVTAAAGAGFDGVIIPDLPPEEGEDLYSACSEKGLDSVLLVAPTSTDERIALAASKCSGFLYCISLTGVTGARDSLSSVARPFLERVAAVTSMPLALGFGVSTPGHVQEVADVADGVVVGSAIVNVIHNCAEKDSQQVVREVTEFVKPLVQAAKKS